MEKKSISLEKIIWKSRFRKRANKRLTITLLILLVGGFILFNAYQSPALQKKFNLIGRIIYEFSGEPNQANIIVDFNDRIGVVREDFYGVSNYNVYLSDYAYISLWGNGTYARSNETWTRQVFSEANLKTFRSWIHLDQLYISESVWNTNDYPHLQTLNNINAIIDQNQWAYENNKTMMYAIVGMPTELQNRDSGYCNSENWVSCSPNNYTKYDNMLISLALNISNNCEYAENIQFGIGNEMYNNNWLNNLPFDDIIKATTFIPLYNHSYGALKSICDGRFKIGGISGNTYEPNLYKTFLTNMTAKMDFYSENIYSPNYNPYIQTGYLKTRLNKVVLDCLTWGADCSHIVVSEWGYYWNEISNEYWSADLAYVYLTGLNLYPENLSLFYHEYDIYDNDTDDKFISETEGNLLFIPYNITKKFAAYHSSGSAIVKSNSSLDNIKTIASKKDNNQHITVVNIGTKANISLVLSGNFYPNLKDLETGEIYFSDNNAINIGVLDQYEIKYLINTNDVPAPVANTPSQSSSGVSGSGGILSNSKINSNEIYNPNDIENNKISEGSNISENAEDETEIGKTTGTGKAIIETNREKYISGLILLLFFGIIAVLITLLYIWNKKTNLNLDKETKNPDNMKYS